MIPNLNPILQALLGTLFTWGVTALGAALVFVFPANNRVFLDSSLGFAGGVMVAASFWSLLAPAIELSRSQMDNLAFIPVAIGFALGALFVHISDHLLPESCDVLSVFSSMRKERNEDRKAESPADVAEQSPTKFVGEAGSECRKRCVCAAPSKIVVDERSSVKAGKEESKTRNNSGKEESEYRTDQSTDQQQQMQLLSFRRILLMIIAVTVHNLPEGLAVGVSFASIGKTPSATFERAFSLALGIGLQNFPEGLAVSLPLAGFGFSPFRAFLYGQLSGMVEPLAALLGATLVLYMETVLPYALSFAAGAMVFVVFDSIVPEAYSRDNGKMSSAFAMVGFLVMMTLEITC